MNGFWETLGISPTRDEAVIRKAYAEQARACHPEDDQEGFLRLRQAYQAALAWAESGGDQLSGQGKQEPGQPRRQFAPGLRGRRRAGGTCVLADT